MNRKHTTWHASHSLTPHNTSNKGEGNRENKNKVNSYSLEMDNVNDTSVLSVISDSEVPNSSEI